MIWKDFPEFSLEFPETFLANPRKRLLEFSEYPPFFYYCIHILNFLYSESDITVTGKSSLIEEESVNFLN